MKIFGHLRRRGDFLPGRPKRGVRDVGEPKRIEDVIVAVNLGFVEVGHGSAHWTLSGRTGRAPDVALAAGLRRVGAGRIVAYRTAQHVQPADSTDDAPAGG